MFVVLSFFNTEDMCADVKIFVSGVDVLKMVGGGAARRDRWRQFIEKSRTAFRASLETSLNFSQCLKKRQLR